MSTTATIKLEGLNSVRELIASLSPALEKANERAQNKMAYELMVAEREQVKSDLDKPVPSTVNSILYKKYGANTLKFTNPSITVPVPNIKGAGVFVGDLFGFKQATVEDLLGVQIAGGLPAGPKRSAVILQNFNWMRLDQVWVPAVGAPLDQYGNLRGSLLAYMLQNMGTNIYAPVKEEAKFILIGEPGNYEGIWWKGSASTSTKGGEWRPLIWFIDKPAYMPRYRWNERAEQEINANFKQILDWYIDDELNKL